MRYPLVRDLAAEDIAVTVTCRVLKFSRQGYFKWRSRPCSHRDLDNAYLTNVAVDINHDDPAFGYRFIADELERLGHRASENRVWRLCSEQRIWLAHSKKRGLSRRPGPPVHDDLVERDFTAEAPNELWLTDITEHRTREGKLYCCVVKDVFSNRIVGYATDARMTSQLAVSALHHAVALRGPGATVVHSDRGSQFRSHAYVKALSRFGLRGSMGRVAACADNAPMESFYSLLQKNVLDSKTWATREETAPGDSALDRAHLSPPPPSASPRQAHADRI